MQAPDISSIEAALNRLMPPAMSETGRISIESMLDELSAEAVPERTPKISFVKALSGIAALFALMFSISLFYREDGNDLVSLDSASLRPDLELVGESERIEFMEDEGWFAVPDGGAMHAVRIRMIGENSLRDTETGIVMQISEPREEMLLMPVSTF